MGSRLWEKARHTDMKHLILERYLQAWLPIVGRWNRRLAIIDGFAGPGEYSGGEDGSPVIILNTVLSHQLRDRLPETVGLFIEKNPEHAANLKSLLSSRFPQQSLKRVSYHVIEGEFAPILQSLLDGLRDRNAGMAPCLAFIDPFGIAGIPMTLLAQFMEHPKSEVLINFAFDPVNRHLSGVNPAYESHYDDLYGCREWRDIRALEGEERHRALHEMYENQLRKVTKAPYILSFGMRDMKNRKLYYLVFATKHYKGLDKMKESMWKADPAGKFEFSDYAYNPNQLSLFPPEPDFEELARHIYGRFRGKREICEEVKKWVIIETERYAGKHVREALRVLDTQGKLGNRFRDGTPYTRKNAYPDDVTITFY